jgi:hypothetical protein
MKDYENVTLNQEAFFQGERSASTVAKQHRQIQNKGVRINTP